MMGYKRQSQAGLECLCWQGQSRCLLRRMGACGGAMVILQEILNCFVVFISTVN
ncbi:MAG: hypothetical protein KatS3mg105_1127 [Gemmatales bacterium]|nr:MAG: hypothetical protein KatS3mg105_1127 [Gemmatales bacterium]